MIWFRPQCRVLFVCTANVCRSPLAEGLLRSRLHVMGLGRRVAVRSAGTSVGQPGRRPDPRAAKLAAAAGVSLRGIRARPLRARMIERSDFVLVMEHRHLAEVASLMPGQELPGNVFLLGGFAAGRGQGAEDIPDPYYGDLHGFTEVFALIDAALSGFVGCLEERFAAP